MDTSTLSYSAQYRWSCPSSDSEFYSVSSPETVSPAPSVDFGFSPPSQRRDPAEAARLACSETARPSGSAADAGGKLRRARSKNPSKQRRSASEKEKLRMRDLTKALHHLRSYLPPSVAPAGQTLTKIETLRLSIRYISHLSAQLGQRREMPDAGCQSSPEILGYFQCSSMPGHWGQGQGQSQHTGRYQNGLATAHPGQQAAVDLGPYSSPPEVPLDFDSSLESLLQSPQSATQSCQVYCKSFGCQLVPQDLWS